MWLEPLTAGVIREDQYSLRVSVIDPRDTLLASVRCDLNEDTGCGAFGEMNIEQPDGGPRQVSRALVLLVRAALRYAAERGITKVQTRIMPNAQVFAARVVGLDQGARFHRDGSATLSGELHHFRTRALERTTEDGSWR